MEERGQLGAPSALLLGKDPPVPIKQTAGSAPDTPWTFRKIAGLVTDRTVCSLVTIPVTLSKKCNDLLIAIPKRCTRLLQTKCISVWNATANAPDLRSRRPANTTIALDNVYRLFLSNTTFLKLRLATKNRQDRRLTC